MNNPSITLNDIKSYLNLLQLKSKEEEINARNKFIDELMERGMKSRTWYGSKILKVTDRSIVETYVRDNFVYESRYELMIEVFKDFLNFKMKGL